MNTYRDDHPKRRTAFRRQEDRLLRKQIDIYIKLFNIGQVITSEMNFAALFDVIADQTNKILDSQRCSVFLIDEKGANLTTFVSTDIKRNEIRIPSDQGVAGWVFCNQLPLIVDDAYSDNRFYPGIDKITGFKTINILCVPLINRKKECIGTLQALNKKSGDFTDDDREIVTYLSYYVTVAIENARLYEELTTADRAKERAISHLSHELRTPLSIISSAFAFIEKKSKPSTDTAIIRAAQRGRRSVARLMEMQEKADDIIKLRPIEESERMLTIVSDAVSILEELTETHSDRYEKVLHLIKNRIDSIFAFEEPRIEKISLDGALKEVLQNELPSNRRDYPEIVTSIEDGRFIEMDRNVLKKVLSGLLKNAVEHTPDGGLIEITARSDGNEIQVDFQDYGVGISDENQKSIFSGFYHARDTSYYTSKKPYDFGAGGMGLDLLRTKIFARMYGFSLNVDSKRCRYIPRDTDQCEGRVSDCPHIKGRSECLASGCSRFTLFIPTSN
jgi:signal transduction histidine kinase